MNIDQIRRELDDARTEFRTTADAIEARLYEALSAHWDADTQLQAELVAAESEPRGYQGNEWGEIESWRHAPALSLIDESYRELFESYVSDRGMRVDWENDAITLSQGDDNYMIQRGRDRGAGIYQNGKRVFSADDCLHDGEWDDATAAHLIETRMEAEGCFPGVFTVDYHGNVFPFETLKLAAQYIAPVESEDAE